MYAIRSYYGLREANKLDCLQLVHFHLGSQIANIRDIQGGIRECGRFYAELRQLGANIEVVDVGGGLGVITSYSIHYTKLYDANAAPDNQPKLNWALFHPRYWAQWLGQALLWLIVQLPFPAIMALGAGLGWLSMKILPRRVRIARTNLMLAFPEWTEAQREACIKENFANVGRAIFETAIAWNWPDSRIKKIMQVEGQEHVEAAVAEGKGMLLLSAHFMTLELNARMFGILRPGVGVYRPNTNPVLEYAQYHGRCKSNKYLVDRTDVKGMIKALRQGEALWYAPDHDYGRNNFV